MDISFLEDARKQSEEAESNLRSAAKSAVNEAVAALLSDPDINSVAWAQKAGEYNDEGMYPGVTGPFLNVNGFDPESGLDSIDRDTMWDLVDYYHSPTADSRLNDLKKILDLLGAEILAEVFGEESLVLAYTIGQGIVQYETEEMYI